MSTKKLFNLNGKVAIITGASKGIGFSIAEALAEYGAKVIVSSRSQEAVDDAADKIQKKGFESKGIACHVGESQQRKELIQKVIKTYGGIDILINNAAINPIHDSLENMTEAIYDKMMDVNLKSAFDFGNLCFPYLKEKKDGSIINIASVEGLKPTFGLGIYSMTKAALIMLTKVQAKEWGKYGIRSNAICPGLIQTKLSSGIWKNESILKKFEDQLPAGRMAQPIEISGLAVYLSSNAGSYSTGGVYTIDGGHMLT
tara:strand:+ start:481 stop:1251 length:771 start_codon:yes stop_codon:yes gene_type:complete